MKKFYSIILLGFVLFGLNNPVSSQDEVTIASWDFTTSETGVLNTTNYGENNLAPTTKGDNITVGGLTRAEALQTNVESAGDVSHKIWGAVGFATTNTSNTDVENGGFTNNSNYDERAAESIAENKFISFTIAPANGYKISLTELGEHKLYKTGSGSNNYIRYRWQYKIGDGNFADLYLRGADNLPDYSLTSNSASGNTIAAVDLSEFSDFQEVDKEITFRIVAYHPRTGPGNVSAGFYNSELTIKGLIESKIAVSIENSTEEKGIVISEKYYDLTGKPISADSKGFVVKRVTYQNGSVETVKQILD